MAAKNALKELEEQQAALRTQINRALSPYGYSEVDTSGLAAERIQDLDERSRRHKTALAERAEAQRRITDISEPGVRETDQLRRNLFTRLGLKEDDEATLFSWLNQRPNYLDFTTMLAQVETIRSDRRQSLTGYEPLLEMATPTIQVKIDEECSFAGKRDELSNRIGQINQSITEAKRGNEVTCALDSYEDAVAELSDARQENCRAVLGCVMTEWVRQLAVGRSRPQVFQRANELFVRFTNGLLHLNLDDRSEPPRFTAQRDSEPGRPVDELSLGECA